MARQTYAYLGSGKIKMREVGAAAPLIAIGNASALTFGAQLDTKELKNFTQPGGGTYAKADRVSSVSVNLTVHDINGENLARATGGAVTVTAAGNVAAEPVVAFKGGTVPLARAPSAITSVTPAGGGTAYTAGEDYIITPGGIEIPADSGIPDAVDADTPNIAVTYANTRQQVVEAMVNSGREYELLFEGLNEAESDAPVVVHAFRVKFSPAQAINWIGDDFAALELAGTSLPDVNKVGNGISRYWKATIVE
jgi:hypothetical protein